MNEVYVSVFSENEHQFNLRATHPTTNDFRKAWDTALEVVRQKYPHEWQVADIEDELRMQGWTLKRQHAVEVSY